MKKQKLVFATNNPHKLHEINNIEGLNMEILSLKEIGFEEDIPEDFETLEENARQKACIIHQKSGLNCFADDTGLEIEALNGRPGVFSARYAGLPSDPEKNIEKILLELSGETNRKARFRTVIALILDGQEVLFEGTVEGEILTEKHGKDGFGYDPIFRPNGYSQSFAEMNLEMKNKISHRARAMKQLLSYLMGD